MAARLNTSPIHKTLGQLMSCPRLLAERTRDPDRYIARRGVLRALVARSRARR